MIDLVHRIVEIVIELLQREFYPLLRRAPFYHIQVVIAYWKISLDLNQKVDSVLSSFIHRVDWFHSRCPIVIVILALSALWRRS